MNETIAVIGAGNGACTIAADLTLNGYKVNLYEIPELAESFEPIRQKREITITGKSNNGVAKLNMATHDIRKAADGVETIFVVVPAFGHKRIAELLTPFLTDGQLIALFPGAFGTITFLEEMNKQKIDADVTFAEAVTLPYGTRLKSRNEVIVYITTVMLPVGVFPAKRTEAVISRLRKYYPEITACQDILDAALNNLNPVVHPAPAILSTSSVEKPGFCLYRDGITDSVKRVMIAMDRERIEVRKACGIETEHYGYRQFEPFEIFADYFGKGDMEEVGYKMKGPSSMKDRYITEDIPYGLVFYSTVGKRVGVKTPVCDAIINLASAINETNYWETGANIRKMFVGGWDINKLNKFLFEGK